MFEYGVSYNSFVTWARFETLGQLLSSQVGLAVVLKIAIFAIMVSTALVLTFRLNRQLRKAPFIPPDMKVEELKRFPRLEEDGKVLVAVRGLVYDLSKSKLWREGEHAGRHRAGRDLSEAIKHSPHGMNVLKKFKPLGYTGEAYREHMKRERALGVFRLMAVLNLLLGVSAILLSSSMHWLL